MRLKKTVTLGLILGFMAWMAPAHANLQEMKKYKEAFPDAKPKCIECHVSDKPKKEDGEHEANDYGKAVITEAKDPKATTGETYKKVGTIEDFNSKAKK